MWPKFGQIRYRLPNEPQLYTMNHGYKMNHSYVRFGAVPTGSVFNWLYKSETKSLSRDFLKGGQDRVGTVFFISYAAQSTYRYCSTCVRYRLQLIKVAKMRTTVCTTLTLSILTDRSSSTAAPFSGVSTTASLSPLSLILSENHIRVIDNP